MDIETLQKRAQSLIKELVQFLKIDLPPDEELTFNSSNELFLTLGEQFVLVFYLDEEAEAIILSIPIAELPEEGAREDVMLELLQGNYVWNRTGGGILGVDKDSGVVVLSSLLDLRLNTTVLSEATVSELINVADYWKKKMSAFGAVSLQSVAAYMQSRA
jgi:hypothetical protein